MVACRIKPRDAGDGDKGQNRCVSVARDAKTVAWAGENGSTVRRFTFDYAAAEEVRQEELFERVSLLPFTAFFF